MCFCNIFKDEGGAFKVNHMHFYIMFSKSSRSILSSFKSQRKLGYNKIRHFMVKECASCKSKMQRIGSCGHKGIHIIASLITYKLLVNGKSIRRDLQGEEAMKLELVLATHKTSTQVVVYIGNHLLEVEGRYLKWLHFQDLMLIAIHNITKQLHDLLILKKEVATDFFLIIYNCLLKSSQFTSRELPMNKESQ